MAKRFSTGHANAVCSIGVKPAYANFVIGIFAGAAQPASADAAETGTLVALITLNGGAFTGGVSTNGLNFGTVANGTMGKPSGDTWSGVGLAAAGAGVTARWFRVYANAYTTGASTTAVRWDGAISTSSSSEMQLTSLTITEGVPVVIQQFDYTPNRGI